MPQTKQLRKLLLILLAPAMLLALSAVTESPFGGLLGLVLSLVAGLYCAREIMWSCEWTGIRKVALHFVVALGCCCLSLGLAFLGCAAIGVRTDFLP